MSSFLLFHFAFLTFRLMKDPHQTIRMPWKKKFLLLQRSQVQREKIFEKNAFSFFKPRPEP